MRAFAPVMVRMVAGLSRLRDLLAMPRREAVLPGLVERAIRSLKPCLLSCFTITSARASSPVLLLPYHPSSTTRFLSFGGMVASPALRPQGPPHSPRDHL